MLNASKRAAAAVLLSAAAIAPAASAANCVAHFKVTNQTGQDILVRSLSFQTNYETCERKTTAPYNVECTKGAYTGTKGVGSKRSKAKRNLRNGESVTFKMKFDEKNKMRRHTSVTNDHGFSIKYLTRRTNKKKKPGKFHHKHDTGYTAYAPCGTMNSSEKAVRFLIR